MARDAEHLVLQTLDNPPRLLFWGIDEFLVMAIPAFVGLATGQVIVLISGFLLRPFYKRLRRRFPKGSIKHRLYWHLPNSAFRRTKTFIHLPPSHIRELLL